MIDIERATRGFLLIAVANSVPWALGRVFGDRWAAPLDFGVMLRDGERLFGAHKTWRGLIAGVLACAAVSEALASGYLLGMGVGAIALLADALSSAAKRRLRRAPGSEIPGLDQLPESVLPLAVFACASRARILGDRRRLGDVSGVGHPAHALAPSSGLTSASRAVARYSNARRRT